VRATVFYGTEDIRSVRLADAEVIEPTDAVVQVTRACVCGSDIWAYRGLAKRAPGTPIGHELIGVVADVGADVRSLCRGDEVISPFSWSDGTCRYCGAGLPASCVNRGFWGRTPGAPGMQAEAVRVPFADGTLVRVPRGSIAALPADLLSLSDVMCTGHHAAVSAGVRPGSTVAVVGDGAVGLCAVLAAARLGAARVMLLGHHIERHALARQFGATDVITGGNDEARAAVLELTGGYGADCALECVGSEESLSTSVGVCHDGGTVGFVGVPHLVGKPPFSAMFDRNVGLRGGVAPARAYIPLLLRDVLDGELRPGRVFDQTFPLHAVGAAYAAMHSRKALKAMLVP
jgi:threonine dehydrogenase-like Zn-dependent dehydrogenase